MTKAEEQHMSRVAALGCLIDAGAPAEIHHVRRYGEKRNNFKVVPLSYRYHRGPDGIHQLGKKEFERRFMTQDEMLTRTEELLRG